MALDSKGTRACLSTRHVEKPDAMTDDYPELPSFLRIPQAERDAAWVGRRLTTPRPMMDAPKVEDPATVELRRQVEAAEAAKKK